VLRYGPAGGRGCPARSGNRPARRSAWLWYALGTGSALPWYALGTRSGLALEHARHDVRPGAGIRAAGPGPAAGIPPAWRPAHDEGFYGNQCDPEPGPSNSARCSCGSLTYFPRLSAVGFTSAVPGPGPAAPPEPPDAPAL